MKNWRRNLRIAGVIVLLSGLYAWFFGFQTMMIVQARSIARKAPVVRLVPQNLPDTSTSTAKGMKLSYLGYDFEVPWDDLDPGKTKVLPNHVVLAFRSGKVLMFSAGQAHELAATLMETSDKEMMRQLYGDARLASDYALMSLILNSAPQKMTLLTPRREIASQSSLIVIKAVMAPEESGIYNLETSDLKGFQWGDPQARPRLVSAELFGKDCDLGFVFFGPGKGLPLGVSQAEINRVVQSVHKITDSHS